MALHIPLAIIHANETRGHQNDFAARGYLGAARRAFAKGLLDRPHLRLLHVRQLRLRDAIPVHDADVGAQGPLVGALVVAVAQAQRVCCRRRCRRRRSDHKLPGAKRFPHGLRHERLQVRRHDAGRLRARTRGHAGNSSLEVFVRDVVVAARLDRHQHLLVPLLAERLRVRVRRPRPRVHEHLGSARAKA
jgi:hypothetical protein